MKISTRTRYGIRAILELACAYGAEPLQIKLIADRQNISGKYLEQLISIMKAAGLVRSVRGPHGGYVLAKEPKDVKISQVFTILEGPVFTADCVQNKEICDNSADCVTRKIWLQVNDAVLAVLNSKTLQDLVDEVKKGKPNYQI